MDERETFVLLCRFYGLLNTMNYVLILAGPIVVALAAFTTYASMVRTFRHRQRTSPRCKMSWLCSTHVLCAIFQVTGCAQRANVRFGCLSRVQGYELKASIAFPALALFNLLRQPIRQMPECITSFINARVAAGRLQEYIQVPSCQDWRSLR